MLVAGLAVVRSCFILNYLVILLFLTKYEKVVKRGDSDKKQRWQGRVSKIARNLSTQGVKVFMWIECRNVQYAL